MSLPVGDSATITLSLHDWHTIEREFERLRAAEAANAIAAPPLPPDVARVAAALQNAIQVVQFAVGNVPPETVRGWPKGALAELAARLPAIFPGDSDYQVLSTTFAEFVRSCHDVDQIRATRLEAAQRVVAATSDPA